MIWLVLKWLVIAWALLFLVPFALAALRIAPNLPRLLWDYLRGKDHAPRMTVTDIEADPDRWKENAEHDIRMSRVHFD